MKRIIALILSLLLSGSLFGSHQPQTYEVEVPPPISDSRGSTEATEAATEPITVAENVLIPSDAEAQTEPTQYDESQPSVVPSFPAFRDNQPSQNTEPPVQLSVPSSDPPVNLPSSESEANPHPESVPNATEPSESQLPVETPALIIPPCSHSWLTIEYPEVGHDVSINSCGCGYQFTDISAYDAHVSQYAGTAEMFTVHGHWGTVTQWVIDTQAYCEWQCSLCGEISLSPIS